MSGSSLLMSIAKDALSAQQYGIDVTAQNIANVDTPGYTKQTPVFTSKTPAVYGDLIFGRGVKIEDIIQSRDAFIEARLREQNTEYMALNEKEISLSYLESILDENSGHSLSDQFVDFWNSWHDLSNNPSGELERSMVCETGSLLADDFNDIFENLDQLEQDLNLSIQSGVDYINKLTSQLATLNQQIVSLGTAVNANDLEDQRNVILEKLAEYIGIKSYEDNSGNLTVTTEGGYVLCDKISTYLLSINGENITWEGSGDSEIVITNSIQGGKIGGWLDIRDNYISKYKADLNELAKSVIWEVNKVHTNGVGLNTFSAIEGEYKVASSGAAINSSGLYFQDLITDGEFKFWVYDSNGDLVDLGGPGGELNINIDADVTTIEDIVSAIDGLDGGNISAEITSQGYLRINTSNGDTFAFSNDTSNALAALGINTFFSGTNANDMDISSTIRSDKGFIAAACIDSSGNMAVGDNSNAFAIANLQYETISIKSWTYERENDLESYDITEVTLENYFHSLVGIVGFQSQNIQKERENNEMIVNQLTETRDNISSVSIDEEMTNLIKYQHAYAAAAKLIATADEMLRTLLEVK